MWRRITLHSLTYSLTVHSHFVLIAIVCLVKSEIRKWLRVLFSSR